MYNSNNNQTPQLWNGYNVPQSMIFQQGNNYNHRTTLMPQRGVLMETYAAPQQLAPVAV